MSEINMGTLYDFNKNAMSNEKHLDIILFNRKVAEVSAWMWTEINDKYCMLLCRERNDFTLFHTSCNNQNNYQSLLDSTKTELGETLMNRGDVLGIDKTGDNVAYEIWIRDIETKETFVYYLFPYDQGVIEIHD